MRSILYTRFMLLKKQWISFIFWLLLPIIATVLIILITNAVQEDSKIPIGIVMEEHTSHAESLLESIKASPLIRVAEMTEAEARNGVESHELDSAFIIEEGYENKVLRGNRNRLITSYKSDLSFAYIPVSEMIASLVQEDTGKSKAAHEIINLANQLQVNESVDYHDIIAKTTEIQQQENLLFTSFSFSDSAIKDSENGWIS